MPNKKSAKKELRKSTKRQVKNTKEKVAVKELVKKTRKAIVAGDKAVKELAQKTVKSLDKAAKKGIIHKNTAARKKSRLQKKINATTKAKK